MSTTQSHDLHRSLLRPFVISTLRAAGFSGTKPSVLDTVVSITERYLLLLAETTAKQALNSHNDPLPTVTDVRIALQDCGVLIPLTGGGEEEWTELLRRPVIEYGEGEIHGGAVARTQAVKRKREEEDLRDLRQFLRWVDGAQHAEMKRVAGMQPEAGAVGIGGEVLKEEDFLEKLMKRYTRGGDESRLQGTILGGPAEGRGVVVEGGLVQHLSEWRPKTGKIGDTDRTDVTMTTEGTTTGA